jgi:hypothetical protein
MGLGTLSAVVQHGFHRLVYGILWTLIFGDLALVASGRSPVSVNVYHYY